MGHGILGQSCLTESGEDDLKKGTQLLEIYALEIQVHTAQKNSKALKTLYEQSLRVKSAIPHPNIMGVIRECGGKMHLRESAFEQAHTDFFEAFKNYDESGSPRRITCLKYLVLASMLMKSAINPFESQEAKAYRSDSQILAMTDLIEYENMTQSLRTPMLFNGWLIDWVREYDSKSAHSHVIQWLTDLIEYEVSPQSLRTPM